MQLLPPLLQHLWYFSLLKGCNWEMLAFACIFMDISLCTMQDFHLSGEKYKLLGGSSGWRHCTTCVLFCMVSS